MSRRAAAALAILCVLSLGMSACTAGSHSGDLADVADVTATILQQRSDVAERHAQVLVGNTGEEAIVVGAVTVVDPRFAAPATRVVDRRSRIAAGSTVGIRVGLPALACDVGHRAQTTVEIEYQRGERSETARLVAADSLGFLPALHERECRAQQLAEAAAIAFVEFTPSPPGTPATLMLEALPTGAGEARLVSIRNTNLLRIGDDRARELTPLGVRIEGTEPIRVALPLLPFRCDAHAVQEDKRGTIFTLEVTASGESGPIEVPVPAEMKGHILSWVLEWCGLR